MHAIALGLHEFAPLPPHLPDGRSHFLAHLAASAVLHAMVALAIATWTKPSTATDIVPSRHEPVAAMPAMPMVHLVFLAPTLPSSGGGGGGGGNQQPEPIRRAQGIGTDAVTLRTRPTPPPAAPVAPAAAIGIEEPPQLPAIFLDAKPLASGAFEQTGLPNGTFVTGTSTGPGSGGGVGTGLGTGIGPGRGPGLGPGSGGGTGGGAYRPGGAVSAPSLISQVKPLYTAEALENQIQGTVVLEAIVTSDGCASQIRVVRSLDRGGLDEEAVTAVAQWRFEPGRLGGAPVDVIVTILVDFLIR
jgi:TonB family protein